MQQNLSNFDGEENDSEKPINSQENNEILRSKNGKTIYSHSRLSSFEQCKLKFRLAYIDKLETEIEGTVETFMGKRVHDALEKLYKDIRFQKINTLQELLDFYNTEWEKNWNQNILIVKDYLPENYKRMGERYIKEYYERFSPFDQDKTIATEMRVLIKIGEEKNQIQGFIDRLAYEGDGVYAIHDYKTSNTLMTQEYADKDRQLALYAIAVKKQFKDCKKIRLIWHYLAFDKDVESSRTDKELEELKKEATELIKEIELCTDFPARKSTLCSWCEYQEHCPNFKHLYSLKEKSANEYINEEGVVLVNKFAEFTEKRKKAEEELEKIKEAILDFAEKKGYSEVYGSDVIASIKSYPKLSFPKRGDPRQNEFFETVKKLGLWDEVSTVDVYNLAKKINSDEIHPELIKVLEKFFERGRNDKIYLRKK